MVVVRAISRSTSRTNSLGYYPRSGAALRGQSQSRWRLRHLGALPVMTRTSAAFAGVVLTVLSTSVYAQTERYPSRPVRIVVGFAAGGGTDLAARAIAQKLTDAFGTSFIVDNRPGASGNLAAEIVSKATPDGYTIF